MRAAAASLALALCACASPRRPQAAPGAEPIGLPGRALAPVAPGAASPPEARGEPQLPDILTVPSAYRLLLVDGHLALVRETDARAFRGGSSLRIIAGDAARGELSYEPAPLAQELAAELADSRERTARMNAALETVMQRSRELSERALELEAQGKRLAQLLAASEARVRQLEAAGRAQSQGEPAPPGSVP
jgi:hypothetical protein